MAAIVYLIQFQFQGFQQLPWGWMDQGLSLPANHSGGKSVSVVWSRRSSIPRYRHAAYNICTFVPSIEVVVF